MKQEKCIVCGKELFDRQLKYCSEACYGKDRYNRSRVNGAEMVKTVKRCMEK